VRPHWVHTCWASSLAVAPPPPPPPARARGARPRPRPRRPVHHFETTRNPAGGASQQQCCQPRSHAHQSFGHHPWTAAHAAGGTYIVFPQQLVSALFACDTTGCCRAFAGCGAAQPRVKSVGQLDSFDPEHVICTQGAKLRHFHSRSHSAESVSTFPDGSGAMMAAVRPVARPPWLPAGQVYCSLREGAAPVAAADRRLSSFASKCAAL